MKNNNQNHQIKEARSGRSRKAATTDILVVPEIVQNNHARLAQKPRRKRRVNYAKKTMNDAFLFNV